MASEHDPQAALELRVGARHLLQWPLTCKEADTEMFRLIRRHEADLDRWFTQRLGYRLHVDADTARLFKLGSLPHRRPLRARTGRPFHAREYVLLSLVLASTAAGPAVISLRDLIEQLRSCAVEAGIELDDGPSARRALVAVLQWMIERGLASELHAEVNAYAGDAQADAVLKVRPDRIALMALPALAGAMGAEDLLLRAERRDSSRQWMRRRLVEDPVLYRSDLSEAQWSELRRRLGEEERLLHEMFELQLEARAEGVAAIDSSGSLAEQAFPASGTVGHAALLLIEALRDEAGAAVPWSRLLEEFERLSQSQSKVWSRDLVASPQRLARRVIALLVDLRLAESVSSQPGDAGASGSEGEGGVRLLPAAARFAPERPPEVPAPPRQGSLF
ncbi:MAG: TIGR02678 family protein [Myxococcales bacterium]|nr:TIGR02678 family protein [Myxococcales bacterium]